MCALRNQNNPHAHGRVPGYYANNNLYPGSYARTDWPTRTSRRVHDGFSITHNYGLDTTSDDINSSIYSSPYYINGRYNSDNLVTQRGNSASVQGIDFLTDIHTVTEDFSDADVQTTLELWQGKQIKFELPYSGKVVGNTVTLKNTGGSTGILSIYFSLTDGGIPVYETSVDLCKVSQDKFEHLVLRANTPIAATASPRKRLYVRMEIWDEIELDPRKRDENPFNTGKKIEIAATGKGNHDACVYRLQNKNEMVTEKYDYDRYPSRPLIGLLYNSYSSVPTDRLDNMKVGATVSLNKYRYDIFCAKEEGRAEMIIYDKEMNKILRSGPNNDKPLPIKVDGRVTQLNIAQVTDANKQTWVYYVDGYSPLQRFKIGEWVSESFPVGSVDNIVANIDDATWYASDLGTASGTYVFTYDRGQWKYNEQPKTLSDYGISLNGAPSEGATITVIYTVSEGGTKTVESIQYVDARPVIAASLIMFHNNRLYLMGFRNDPNLIQVSSIEKDGPNFTTFPYRLYAHNRSPYDTSLNPITAVAEYTTDELMVGLKNGFVRLQSNVNIEDGTPQQIPTYMDSAGVATQGDLVNYKGMLYSFDQKEGIRRFTGGVWSKLPTTVDSHYDRVDMSKPRKLWGYSNKLYFNYTDSIDGKYKCLVWDMDMNYQQYPWFQDVDIPFCDTRYDESEDLVGIHPDYPCIMQLYKQDHWRRLDSPIVFERHTKYMSLPGNAADIIVKRAHTKVIANSNRWWWIGINADKEVMVQFRGHDKWWRQPSWDTLQVHEPAETPFPTEDVYEEDAIYRLTISHLRIRGESVQMKIKCKTFRAQCNLVSTLVEVGPRQFN